MMHRTKRTSNSKENINIEHKSRQTSGCLSLSVVVAVVGVALLQAWALTFLWGWFVVPLNRSLPQEIGLWHALGIVLLISLFGDYWGQDQDDETNLGYKIVIALRTLLILGAGWYVHYLMGN